MKCGVVSASSSAPAASVNLSWPAAEISAALVRSGGVKPADYPTLAAGLEALRTGKIALLVVEEAGSLVFHFDRTRPDARIARLEVDDAIQRARGRQDPSPAREELVHEKGSRYIDVRG